MTGTAADERVARLEWEVAELRARLDAMADRVITRCLWVVDGDGRVHVQASAGSEWGEVTVAARDVWGTDDGAAVTIMAGEEGVGAPDALVVARTGDMDGVVGHIGTEHTYGRSVWPSKKKPARCSARVDR